jgi:hypothetical protein
MDRQISISRTCDLSYEAVAELLKHDPNQALHGPGGGSGGSAERPVVHLHTRWSRLNRDAPVNARIGHFEAVSNGHGRVNLSWEADQHKRLLPHVNGHLEVDQVSVDASEFRYVGQYPAPTGILGRLQGAAIGNGVVEDAVGQLLDETITHLRQHHAGPSQS